MRDISPPPRYWFRRGLRFGCTGCGDCCRGIVRPDAYVEVNDADITRLAGHLNLTEDAFHCRYVDVVKGQRGPVTVLKVNRLAHDAPCVFLRDDNTCGVYEARPAQCRAYPFFPEHLKSRHFWDKEAAHCEGVNDGPLITEDEILARMRSVPK